MISYSESLGKMTVAQLKKEGEKYGLTFAAKDKKQDIIDKILEAHYIPSKTDAGNIKVYTPTEEPLKTKVVDYSRPIGLYEEISYEDFYNEWEEDKALLLDSMSEQKKILTAKYIGFSVFHDPTHGNKNEVFINGVFGRSKKIIMIPFYEFVLDNINTVAVQSREKNGTSKAYGAVRKYEKAPSAFTKEEKISYITARSGASFDFVVTNMLDPDDQTALILGSRLEAAKIQRKRWNDMEITKEGIRDYKYRVGGRDIEVKIAAVFSKSVYAEINGYEIYIPMNELDYNIRTDIREQFFPGDTILCRIKELERDPKGKIKSILLSRKDTKSNPAINAVQSLLIDGQVEGVIVAKEYQEDYGYRYYVNVLGLYDVYCRRANSCVASLRIGDSVAVTIVDVEYQKGKARGVIVHKNRTRQK